MIKMKIIKLLLFWVLGFACGLAAMILIRNSHTPLVEITIKNESSFIVNRITIRDDKLKNIYLIENFKPENFKKIFLYADGEIGYEVVAEVNNGKLLKMEVYAESGYSDLLLVENDSIIYKSRTHFSY